ncbi:hypothetical protein ACE04B_41655, partial [Rhizobium phaseoli]
MGKIGYGAAQLQSAEIMQRLRKQATHPTRVATLDRLETAVAAITSGNAFQLARQHNRDTTRFRPSRKKIIAEDVGEFVRLRQFIEGSKTTWTGPTADFIRHDKDISLYLAAVTCELNHVATGNRKRGKGSLSAEIERIVQSLPSLSDQLLIRRALESKRPVRA